MIIVIVKCLGLKIKETVYQNLPLHYAAQYKADAKIAEVVLTSYSDAALIQNGYGRLPIHLAARYIILNNKSDKNNN